MIILPRSPVTERAPPAQTANMRIFATFLVVLVSGCVVDTGGETSPLTPSDPAPPPTPDDVVDPVHASSDVGLYEMAMDDTHVYWVVEGGRPSGAAALRRMPRDGGAIETLYTMPARTYALALDATDVYFAHTTDGTFAGAVWRLPKAGGAPVQLTAAFNPTSIAVDATHVYYSAAVSPPGSVWRIAKSGGGAPELVADDVDNPWDLAVDATHLYVSEMNRGRIVRFPKSTPGAAPEILAAGWVGTGWLAVDDTHVVFGACPTGDCPVAGLYRMRKDGGELTLVHEATWGGSGKVALAPGAIVWGNWVLLDGAAPAQVVVPTGDDGPHAIGVTAAPGQAFLGDFYSGDIYEVRWPTAPGDPQALD
jgi:hypothetical protein